VAFALLLLLLPLLYCAGVCGNPTQEVFPHTDIANFRGPVTDYAPGSIVRFRVLMQVNHGGRLAFRICDRSSNLDQACFNSRQLLRWAASCGHMWPSTLRAMQHMAHSVLQHCCGPDALRSTQPL
jgi:hypothetical protein